VTSEGHGIGDAVLGGGFCGFGLEATCSDDLPLEDFPKLLGRDRTLPLWMVTFPFTRGSMMCR
jgi:hypothetical protein